MRKRPTKKTDTANQSDVDLTTTDKRSVDNAYIERYRALGFTDEEIEDIIIRIVEDR